MLMYVGFPIFEGRPRGSSDPFASLPPVWSLPTAGHSTGHAYRWNVGLGLETSASDSRMARAEGFELGKE